MTTAKEALQAALELIKVASFKVDDLHRRNPTIALIEQAARGAPDALHHQYQLGHADGYDAGLSAAESRGAQQWIPCSEQMPEEGTVCLVALTNRMVEIDCWREQHECPVSFSSATIPIGIYWDNYQYEDVTHWQPIPAAPTPPKGEA